MVDEKLRLRRHKTAATALLIGMCALLVIACVLPQGISSGLLKAAALAGIVGGLADWFAVVALFRHPLGLPIPHTALVPAGKDRIGAALGSFLASHVLTEEEAVRLTRELKLPEIAAAALEDEEGRSAIVDMIIRQAPGLLNALGDGRLADKLAKNLPSIANGSGPSLLIARLVKEMLDSGSHRPMIQAALERLRMALAARRNDIKASIGGKVRNSSGAVVGWLAGDKMADALMSALDTELDGASAGSGAFVDGIEAWLRDESIKLRSDPMRAYEIGKACRDALSSPEASDMLGQAMNSAKKALEEDIGASDGVLRRAVDEALISMSASLRDGELGQQVDAFMERSLHSMLPGLRTRMEEFVSAAVSRWDEDTLVERLENKVGPDLQYIRMNGTLVGFIVGGVLHALLALVGS